jgi:hypothetical protein
MRRQYAKFFASLSFSLDELEHNYPDENDEGETPYETLERLTGGPRNAFQGCDGKDQHQIDYELGLIRENNTTLLPDGP